ncbi:MAG TPA: hypothetical protein VG477_09505, partial [Thermoanaerobaculia bacterium]|nr:hypothetical protein [Thermoanaerobaculia bacterium]
GELHIFQIGPVAARLEAELDQLQSVVAVPPPEAGADFPADIISGLRELPDLRRDLPAFGEVLGLLGDQGRDLLVYGFESLEIRFEIGHLRQDLLTVGDQKVPAALSIGERSPSGGRHRKSPPEP